MKLDFYHVVAFSQTAFSGNPAIVILLDDWLDDELLQNIAMEFNLSETAFIVKEGESRRIRWFTPTTEVNLCGHATLASAHVLFRELNPPEIEVRFESHSGLLTVERSAETYTLDFPLQPQPEIDLPAGLVEALGVGAGESPVVNALGSEDLVVVFKDEQAIRNLGPDFSKLAKFSFRGICVTAPGEQHDFVCRFFAPASGIDEDPVTGSAYTRLAPYYAETLGKTKFNARQLSKRGGELQLEVIEDRIKITGYALTLMRGTLELP